MILAGDPPMEVPRIASLETSVAPISGSEPARGSSRGGWPDDDVALAAGSASTRRYSRMCSGCAVIQASGKSEFKSRK